MTRERRAIRDYLISKNNLLDKESERDRDLHISISYLLINLSHSYCF